MENEWRLSNLNERLKRGSARKSDLSLSRTMSLLVLSLNDVDRITSSIRPEDVQNAMADVFKLLSSSTSNQPSDNFQSPHRISITAEKHAILFMPARINLVGTSIKLVSVPLSVHDQRGLPGTTVIFDKDTGTAKAVINARNLTALRNAGGSLLSTKLVGPQSPVHVVCFGAGNQIRAHLELHIKAYPSIKTCAIINRSVNERFNALVASLGAQFNHIKFQTIGFSFSADEITENNTMKLVKEAISNADIVICATPSAKALFPSSWVTSGTHVILIGSYKPEMREIDDVLLRRALPTGNGSLSSYDGGPILLVDSRSACVKEFGEFIQAGLDEADMLEIGGLVRQVESGYDTPASSRLARKHGDFTGPITLFKSVGIGLQDVAIACTVLERAKEMRRNGDQIGLAVDAYDTML